MNCPKCGTLIQPDHKFCKSCGAPIAAAGIAQAAGSPPPVQPVQAAPPPPPPPPAYPGAYLGAQAPPPGMVPIKPPAYPWNLKTWPAVADYEVELLTNSETKPVR